MARRGPPAWLADEPAARQSLAPGADLVLFSGDKLLGGPQAGIIAGRADLVAVIARHPLARAVRCGGLVLHALQDLALCYLHRRGTDIPFWRMASCSVDELQARAEALGAGAPSAMPAVPGGGTLPGVTDGIRRRVHSGRSARPAAQRTDPDHRPGRGRDHAARSAHRRPRRRRPSWPPPRLAAAHRWG